MTAKRFPRQWLEQGSVTTRSSRHLPPNTREKANSGCMRGNDRYGQNGSASVGISQEKEPLQQSYNDFVHFNYGSPSQRLFNNTGEKT